MKIRQRLVLFVFDKLVETFKITGDIIFIIWALQLAIGFEWHNSYWFTDYHAWVGSACCYMLGLLIHIFELHYQQKYKD